ncbi:hypothetical protein M3Y97_00906200 [Aphelenchoides bicaudatus]|nr:hypothetical protein M3Y97_00906200 [Aphelenchoides bicaudatus]
MMQSQIARWEQSEPQVLCPLLASSPPPAPDFSQAAYNFLSSTPAEAVFNPFTSIPTAATTPQIFITPTASQATVFDSLDPQQKQSYVSLLQSTISSNTNSSPQQVVASPLAAAANANLTEYLKNIAALNVTSAATTTATTELNKILSSLQPSTPKTTQLFANNESSLIAAAGQDSIVQTRTLLEPVTALDSAASTNPFAQPQQQLASLLGGQSVSAQQSIPPNSLLNSTDLKSLLSNSLLQPQQQATDLQSNPFLPPAQQQAGAFSFVSSPQQSTAPKSGFSLYSPQLTEALKMLRSPIRELPAATKKPIPLNNPIDLASFRVKDPFQWKSDDVVAWVLDVARRHNIPREEIGVIEFGSHNGVSLTRMTEQNFKEINSSFGSLMYAELRRLLNDEPINTIDDLIRYCKNGDTEDERPTTSRGIIPQQTLNNQAVNLLNQTLAPATNTTFGRFLSATSPLSPLVQNGVAVNAQQTANLAPLHHSPVANVLQLQQTQAQPDLQQLFGNPHLAAQGSAVASVFAQQRKQLNDLQQQQILHQQLLQKHSPAHHQLGMQSMPGPSSVYNGGSVLSDYGAGSVGKIRKNKDGRPRKRSQHTKGNKLWEFIRDALKDPASCPSIVRWEDPEQGVFRIVESEKLARLWGEKKNNQKMTYEKLSRAMRTYYEKQILVPVPKTGLYPKKLVYKFGPGAHGWTAPPHLAQACLKLQQHEQH